jgi:hypothetical protein
MGSVFTRGGGLAKVAACRESVPLAAAYRKFFITTEGDPMSFNLFQWIREGVRHSVIQGVADAVETIGTPPNDDNLSARLGEYLRSSETESLRIKSEPAGQRKRLGRSLKDIDTKTA